MPFPSQVNAAQAPAVAGDFASTNPRMSVLAAAGGLVAGAAGVTVGRFAWTTEPHDSDGTAAIVNNFGTGPVTGFVHRAQQALITAFLAESSMVVPQGFPMTLFSGGDFWVQNDGTTVAVPGQKAYASFANGKVNFAATGSPSGATASAYTIAAETFSFTGTITGDVLTTSGVVTGTIYPGSVISGTGVTTGQTIVSQLTGVANGAGTYLVSIPEQAVTSTTISGTYGLLTLTTITAGTFAVGDTLSSSTGATYITPGTYITQIISGSGSVSGCTAAVNLTGSQTTGTLTGATNVETKFIAMSSGLPGELVKISNWPLG